MSVSFAEPSRADPKRIVQPRVQGEDQGASSGQSRADTAKRPRAGPPAALAVTRLVQSVP